MAKLVKKPSLYLTASFVLCYASVTVKSQFTKTINLGLVSPGSEDRKVGFDFVAAASTMGIDKAHADGYLTDTDVVFHFRNGRCDPRIALGVAVGLYKDTHVDGIIGIPCAAAALHVGKILAYWNVPFFSFSSADPDLADKEMFQTLVRLISPFNRMAEAMVEFFHYYRWTSAVILTGPHENDYCDYSARALVESFLTNNITTIDWTDWRVNPNVVQMTNRILKIKTEARIVMICGDDEFIRTFMLIAQSEKMTDGDYVFLTVSLLPQDNWEKRWIGGDGRDEEARRAFEPLMMVALGFTAEEEAEEFMDLLPHKMAEAPWYYNKTLEEGFRGSLHSLFLHDAAYLWALAADKAYKMGESPLDGRLMFELAKEITFNGKSGFVALDDNRDRIGDYTVWALNPSSASYSQMMDILMTKEPGERVIIHEQKVWGTLGTKPPADAPACGFRNEFCPRDNSTREISAIAGVVAVVLAACVAGLGVLIYKRRKFEEDLELMLWKVKYDEIEFVAAKLTGDSVGSVGNHSTFSEESSSFAGAVGAGDPNASVKPAYYRGTMVAVKILQKTGVLLTREDHLELKRMRDVQHDNLNPFIGLCIDPPNICILSKFASRGSLQDVIENDDIKLDINFKKSLIYDVINGMDYLHKSDIRSHGRLRSPNCVVDGRWVLRICDYGLANMRESRHGSEHSRYRQMFWTAPELLRELAPPRNGTQKGDVYSFAIILQEILYRSPPFEVIETAITMVPKDIVGRVRNGETPAFRPIIPGDDDDTTAANIQLVLLMKDCWTEESYLRPDFNTIKNKFAQINRGKRYNIMDNMLRMMERYATNLEEVINERTKQLVEEKKKTDMLLYRMLPKVVADCLKTGKNVEPELFKQVTVYFSDIVSFTQIAAESSPLQVIDFLNDLWTMFDGVIEKHDVYKVETIGDAYMVASGLPERNGRKHAKEIADMSLEILNSTMRFRIRHMPDTQLKVRIGVHSGSVVAGVVGLTMPRYCLFGDTVNLASRMESTGEALRIHLTSQARDALSSLTEKYVICRRGEIEVKGKGILTTYWLEGKEGMPFLRTFTD